MAAQGKLSAGKARALQARLANNTKLGAKWNQTRSRRKSTEKDEAFERWLKTDKRVEFEEWWAANR
jgi:hypothetical protein